MKIIAYGARVDEIQYFKQWAKDTGNTLEYHTNFSMKTPLNGLKGLMASIHCRQRHMQPAFLKKCTRMVSSS